jgi:hypothetical protein
MARLSVELWHVTDIVSVVTFSSEGRPLMVHCAKKLL